MSRDDTTVAQPEAAHVARELKHTRALTSVSLDPTGKRVAAGSEDYTIQLWDLASGTATPLTAHESWVYALGFTPGGETMLSGGCEGQLVWWPIADGVTPTPSRTLQAHDGWIRALAVSPDGSLVATAGNDRKVKVWKIDDGTLVHTLNGHEKLVYSVVFHPSGASIASADMVGKVIEWDVAAGTEKRRLDAGKLYAYNGGQGVDYGGVRDLSFNADGTLLVGSGLIEASNPLGAVSNPALVLMDWTEGKEKLLQRPKEDVKGVGWGVRMHPAGFHVMLSGGSSGGVLLFFHADQPNEFFRFNLPNIGRDLDLSKDGLTIATAHHDGILRLTRLAPKAG